ncbi:MAG: ATP-binding cassette domain-containing protein [Candidatus Latescibacteria bacterium]|nr:ATP-binding cassette domain-containing protein [Candidatus Latescibacterota bacterium]
MLGPFTHYVRPYILPLSLGCLTIVLGQKASTEIPKVIGPAVDALHGLANDELARQAAYQQIWQAAFYIVGLALIVAVLGYAMRQLLGRAANRIEYDIRTAYFAHLLKLPLAYYQKHRTGDLMARATNDLNSVHVFFTYGVRGIFETFFTLVFTLYNMCQIDWQLTLIVLAPLPLFSFFLIRMSALIHSRFKAIQDFFGEMSNFVQENLSGMRIVKAYVQQPAQQAAFARLNQTYLDRNRHLILARAKYRPLTYLIPSIGLGLNLWFGGQAVIEGSFSLGEFVTFNAYLTVLIRPVMYMGWVIDRFQRALVAMRRINEVMDVKPAIEDAPKTTAERPPITGQIEFRQLNFAYDEGPVLQDINLVIPAGTTIGIMGKVGSGKTTLARLVPRLIQAGPGQVLIDGVPVEEWPLDQLRQAIGYVSQNPFLFSNTIAANIGFGGAEPSREDIVEAATQAQLSGDVEEFEQGFDTVIGERGVTLSGGQKQRSTLARAFIRQPRILILDDSLSAVDTRTEEAVLGHLGRIMEGRTTLIIAHRVSTLRDADWIVVLEEGRIAEQGRHQDLLDRCGYYADLAARQQLAAELENL